MTKKTVLFNRDPVYRDIQKELRKRIHQGHWRRGALIPSRRALADEFQVSVPTVQKAIADMVAEGTLRVNAKRGTYVFGDPDPEVLLSASGVSPHLALDDARLLGTIDGYVSLVADIRPGLNSFFSSGWPFIIMHEAEYALAQYGMQSRFANRFDAHRKIGGVEPPANEEATSNGALLAAVLAEKPAAVILHESVVTASERPLLYQAAREGICIVVVGSEDHGPDTVSVTYDSAHAGYQATQHLIDRGCRRLLFFSPYHAPWVETRLAGVRLAVAAAGLPADALTERVAPGTLEAVIGEVRDPQPHIPAAYAYACRLFSEGLTVDGVVAANDDSAFGFVRAAGEEGLHLGRDYALIGFDDSPESQALGLTTMHPPCAGMGREAARAVARALRGQNDLASVVLKSRLVLRASTPQRLDGK